MIDNVRVFLSKDNLTSFVAAFFYVDLILILRRKWDLDILWGVLAAVVGAELLPFFEKTLRKKLGLSHAIFNTLVFQIVLVFLCFYILTSSVSYFVNVLVMTVFLTQILTQVGELRVGGELWSDWFLYLRKLTALTQRIYVSVMVLIFVIFSFMLAGK